MRRATIALTVVALTGLPAGVAVAGFVYGDDGANLPLAGTDGPDSLYGFGSDDTLAGRGGDDDLDGGGGSDILSGGDGVDAAVYAGRAAPVDLSLNGRPDDGDSRENDDIRRDVEALYGGEGPDDIRGDDGPNTLDGGPGNDRIDARRGQDAAYGGAGDDNIDVRDGAADVVDCGKGKDKVRKDALDRVRNCDRGGRLTRLPALAVRQVWTFSRRYTVARTLGVKAPREASVRLACKGRGCPRLLRRGYRMGVTRGKVDLRPFLAGRRLRPGARVTVSVTVPNRVGRRLQFTVRSGKLPKRTAACIVSGSGKRARC